MPATPLHTTELPGNISCVAIGVGPPLVMLPGLSRESHPVDADEAHRDARRYAPLARVTGRTVHAVHRPRGLPRGATMADLAASHATALTARFAAPVDVIGVSTGGGIALQLAVDHPAVVRRLVVVAAASWLGQPGRIKLRRYADLIAQRRSGAAVLASVLAGPWLRWPLAALLRYYEHRERHIDPADMLAAIDAECAFDVTPRLHEITAPTLVIAGARDRAFSPALFKATADGIPNARLILYPTRGHIGTMFDPRFGHDVAAFINT